VVTRGFTSRGGPGAKESEAHPRSATSCQAPASAFESSEPRRIRRIAFRDHANREEIHVAEGAFGYGRRKIIAGDQAKERGLVDEMGGIDRAIELVKERAKIAKDEKVALVTYPPKRSILEILMGRTPESALETKLSPLTKIARSAHFKLLSQPGLLRLMPYTIEVR